MITVPYLILLFVSLGMQIVAYKKDNDQLCALGHIIGALCGLYITFIIWLYVGFGESSSYKIMVTIGGKPLYFGTGSIFPVLVFGFILIPGVSWVTYWLAYMITHFISDGTAKILPIQGQSAFGDAAWKFILAFFCFLIGVIPAILILHKIHPGETFIDYLAQEFFQFSFCGPLLAACLFVGIRFIANGIAILGKDKKKRKNN